MSITTIDFFISIISFVRKGHPASTPHQNADFMLITYVNIALLIR